jgi:hypothetical protein
MALTFVLITDMISPLKVVDKEPTLEPCYKMIRRELIKLERQNIIIDSGKNLPLGIKKGHSVHYLSGLLLLNLANQASFNKGVELT